MTEESAKFILGVIAVVLLFLLIFKLAGIMRQNTKYEQAKYLLGEIEATINSLKDGETGTVFVESPRGWLIWLNPEKIKNQKLCICPQPSWGLFTLTNYNQLVEESCDKKGVCLTSEKTLSIPLKCYANTLNCFIIERVPMMLTLDQKADRVSITNDGTTVANRILSKIIADKSRTDLIKGWVFSGPIESILMNPAADITTMIKEAINEEEKEKNIEIEKWYFVIGLVDSSGAVTYYRWASEDTWGDWACWKGLNKKDQFGFLFTDKTERAKSPSEYCFGGDWISLSFYMTKDSKRQDILLEFRADVKE